MHKQLWQSSLLTAAFTILGGIVTMPYSLTHADEASHHSDMPQLLAQAQWSSFTSETGRFAVTMPNQPTMTTDTDEIEGEPIEIYEFAAKTDTSSYSIFYTDLPAAYVSRGTETVLNGIRDRMIDGMADASLANALKASEVAVQLGSHPGRQYVYNNAFFAVDMRLYLAGERVYLVVGTDMETAAIDQFMDSFELL